MAANRYCNAARLLGALFLTERCMCRWAAALSCFFPVCADYSQAKSETFRLPGGTKIFPSLAPAPPLEALWQGHHTYPASS